MSKPEILILIRISSQLEKQIILCYMTQKMSNYPRTRLRRNRKALWSRDLVAESSLSKSDLIMPLFVVNGTNIISEVLSMPDVYRYSIDTLIDKVKSLHDSGVCAVMLFPQIFISYVFIWMMLQSMKSLTCII